MTCCFVLVLLGFNLHLHYVMFWFLVYFIVSLRKEYVCVHANMNEAQAILFSVVMFLSKPKLASGHNCRSNNFHS